MLLDELIQLMGQADRRRRKWYLITLIAMAKKLDITEVTEVLDMYDAYFINHLDGNEPELTKLKQEIIKLYLM